LGQRKERESNPQRLVASRCVAHRCRRRSACPSESAGRARRHIRQAGPTVTNLSFVLVRRIVKEQGGWGRLPRPSSPSLTLDRPDLFAGGSHRDSAFSGRRKQKAVAAAGKRAPRAHLAREAGCSVFPALACMVLPEAPGTVFSTTWLKTTFEKSSVSGKLPCLRRCSDFDAPPA